MDAKKLKELDWVKLKRTDLGDNYISVFVEISSILKQTVEFLLTFERSYSKFLGVDRLEFDQVNAAVLNLIDRTRSFKISTEETVNAGLGRATELLVEVKNFYADSKPRISSLRIYTESQTQNNENLLQSQIQSSINRSEQVLNNKISEIEQKSASQQAQVSETITKAENQLETKRQELDSVINLSKETVVKVEEVKNNVEKLQESVSNFSLDKITVEYGAIFAGQAEKNFKTGVFFGIIFLFTLLSGILMIYNWFLPLVAELKNVTDPKGIIVEFIVRMSFLFFIVWIAREFLKNYNSNMHLFSLNTHRSNSLKSFEIVVRNNVLPENRDGIVKQIAQTIFEHEEDGFINQGKNNVSLSEIANFVNVLKK
jgi:hypothetical protein